MLSHKGLICVGHRRLWGTALFGSISWYHLSDFFSPSFHLLFLISVNKLNKPQPTEPICSGIYCVLSCRPLQNAAPCWRNTADLRINPYASQLTRGFQLDDLVLYIMLGAYAFFRYAIFSICTIKLIRYHTTSVS